jgi:uncharacterized membrane protein YdcZ (DUF606 family)
MELHAKKGKDAQCVFPGKTLVIAAKGASAGFLRPRQKTLTIPNLILDGEEMTSDILTFIDNNGVGSKQVDLITTITGTNLTIKTPSDKWALINGAGGECFIFRLRTSLAATLKLCSLTVFNLSGMLVSGLLLGEKYWWVLCHTRNT